MAWTPISGTMTQYSTSANILAANYYLKFYQSGTTTAFNMATDSTGGTTLDKCQLDSSGYPTTDGTNRFIPYVDRNYKIALYTNSTDADNNATGNADWVIDGVVQPLLSETSNPATLASNVTYTPGGVGAVNTDVQTKLRESVSVKDFGAVGDGVTDDTATIQAALDSLTNGGIAVVPASANSYMINAITSIKPLSNTSLVIEKGATLEAIANSSDNYQVVHIDSVTNVEIVGGGTIKGERTGHTGSTGEGGMCIRTDNASNVMISGLELTEGWGDGIYIGGLGGNSSNIFILKNRIHNNRRNNISVVDGNYGVISGNVIYNANGTNPETGIDLEPGKNENVRNWSVTGNTVYDNNNSGIVAVTPWEPAVSIVRDITISGNTVYSNGNVGISVGRMLACTVAGNTCNDNTNYGIQVTSGVHKDTNEVAGNGVTSDITVSGNTCYNNTDAGIYVNGTNTYTDLSEVNITGNTCSNNATYGIKVDRLAGQTVTDISIDSNVCHANTLDGIYCNRIVDSNVRNNTCNDNAANGIRFTGSTSDTVGAIITGNLCNRNTDTGISAVYVNESVISNNKCRENGEHGIWSFEGHDSTINSNSCFGNSQTTDDTYNGIYIERSDDCVVSANICRHESLTNQHKYGIEIESTAERNLITGNNVLNGGRTANLLDSSGTSRVNNNDGYVTENYGTSSAIATGATIAHGLATTPTYISLTAQSTGPSDVYATADDTNITVNYTGGGTEIFYWEAKV